MVVVGFLSEFFPYVVFKVSEFLRFVCAKCSAVSFELVGR